MTAPIPTPNLDKAASEELTSSEIMQALRELTALDPDKSRYGFQVLVSALSRTVRITMVVDDKLLWRFSDTIEEALLAQRKDLLEIIAEIEADA